MLSSPIRPDSAPCAVAAKPVVVPPAVCAVVSVAERLWAVDSIEVRALEVAESRVVASAFVCVVALSESMFDRSESR